MAKLAHYAALPALLVLLAGCSEHKLGGDFEVNGRKTNVASCQIGRDAKGQWAEVANSEGFRIRLQERDKSTGSGSETVVYLVPPGAQPLEARCSSKVTSRRAINDRVSGSVSANCSAANYTVKASFTYGTCGIASGSI